ncbi:glycosyltransferase family 2 protein [Azospirillum sp. Vi22]|uniref:glycosyltransferase family 2 protein n=1 Tax=Azospirillum baldaniorum TaxID=1064539 RepID=UPI00157AF3A1|nr:glycosyltransferase family 2 protein [Azospirillum baldaniorum]NUB10712.1 glycosyltransferase family 2 protein [Azospirillum baldaniorum]
MKDVEVNGGKAKGGTAEAPPVTVSAVIPTRNRPHLVLNAVESVRAQTLKDVEIVVVVDGPDPATVAALEAVEDRRLRIVQNPASLGPAGARNAGVQAALGEWIAFLDDDDSWAPEKLERQLAAAKASGAKLPVVSCSTSVSIGERRYVWPQRRPEPGEPISDYLIDRRSPLSRPGYLATPTIMVPRSLALAVPMPDYRHFEDWGWLFRALDQPGAELVFVDEPLCFVEIDEGRASLHSVDDWRQAFEWARTHRPLMTGNAYAAFLMTKVVGMARREGDWNAVRRLLAEATRAGDPKMRHYLMFFGTCLVPPSFHRRVRAATHSDAATA